MKRSRKKKTTQTPDLSGTGPLGCPPLFQAFKEAFEWALDVAAQLARDYPEEVEAVERVRRFMRKQMTGEVSHVKIEDVAFTFGLIIGAIERDLPLRFPGAEELWRVIPRHVTARSVRIRPVHIENN